MSDTYVLPPAGDYTRARRKEISRFIGFGTARSGRQWFSIGYDVARHHGTRRWLIVVGETSFQIIKPRKGTT